MSPALRTGTAVYLLTLLAQALGSSFLVWNDLPVFRELLSAPGQQPDTTPYDSVLSVFILLAMQGAYWYRFLRVHIPFRGPRHVLSHFFLFVGRLNFIFASTLFSAVAFRHLPELGADTNVFLMLSRGILFVISLFSFFCFTLEIERLGVALGEPQ